MLPPEYLMNASSDVVYVYTKAEQAIVEDIAKRIVKTGRMTDTASFQLEKVRQFGMLNGDVEKILSEATNKSRKEVRKIISKSGTKALVYDDSIYKAAGLNPSPVAESPALKSVLLQGTNSTLQLVGNYTRTTAQMSKLAYLNSLDQAFIQASSGAMSPNRAISQAIKQVAQNGIEKVAYPSGGYRSVESSIRTAVSTGLNQAVAKLQLYRMDEMGCELVETTSHAGARPTHAEWQGRVFCIKGNHKFYGDFYRETGYGSGEGLCGWNCYHSFFPYFEGLSTRSFSPDPAADAGRDNDEEYLLQQKQRYYERQVRSAKKECGVYNSAMEATKDEELRNELYDEFQKASVKLKRREAKLEEFISQSGNVREREREQTASWSRSVSSKAVWANRKYQNNR